MSLSNRKTLIIAMFAMPVVCYFIGMGALLNMLVSSMLEEQQDNAKVVQEYQRAAEAGRSSADELRKQEERVAQARKQTAEEEEIAEEERSNNTAAQDFEKKQQELEERNAASRASIPDKKAKTQGLTAVRGENRRLNVSREGLKKKLEEAGAELTRLSAECKLARKESERERKRVSVSALEGTRRTRHQTPVFMDCGREKAVLQPQARELGARPSAGDRQAFLGATRSTRYVVFLIRPDGFGCFDNYRSVILSANKESGTQIEFGYEPVNADWELVYPGKEG